MKKIFYLLFIVIAFSSISCHCTKKNTSTFEPKYGRTSAALIIYKTKNDYTNLVPVTLNEEGTQIISYPAPQDIFMGDKLATPTKLKKEYLLDNRGVGINTAFLNYTYEEYSKMKTAPKLEIMFTKIIDKHPFTEYYHCGMRSEVKGENFIDAVNTIIKNDELKKCKCLTTK